MKSVRVWFEKKGSARYISHLDLTRCMGRALKLSHLPVWYTEGFNPRIYMTFSMPLSLGIVGERECMDIRLTEETEFSEVVRRLNEHLPSDIRILEAAEPKEKFDAIAFADYEAVLSSESSADLEKKLKHLLQWERITVTKHGKKGDKELDVKPYFLYMEQERRSETQLQLSFRLPCSVSGSINPYLLLEALQKYEGAEPEAQIFRKRLLKKDFSEIR